MFVMVLIDEGGFCWNFLFRSQRRVIWLSEKLRGAVAAALHRQVLISSRGLLMINSEPTCPNPFLINSLVCWQTDVVNGGCANATVQNHQQPQQPPNFSSAISTDVSSY